MNQFAGVDPMLGLMPFNKPMEPASGQQLDPRTLLAALGHPPAGMPTDPNALMALIRDATPRNIPSAAAAPPEFLDALRNLLTAGPLRGTADSPAAPASDNLDPHVDPFAYLNSLLRSGASSDAAHEDVQQPRHQLGFDGRTVTLHDRDGNFLGAYPATSGEDGVTDPRARKQGPIPEGEYLLDPTETSEVRRLDYLLRRSRGDWGNFRVPVTPMPGTETHGRSGFFVHGGDTPGSAGCIDVGSQDEFLFPQLRKLEGPVRLRVEYPKRR
jgi:hypothetical protein